MRAKIPLGTKRHNLTLLQANYNGTNKSKFICKCDCGNVKEINSNKFGKTKSCGCFILQQNRKCAVSGLPIAFGQRHSTASLDRIDNNRDYTIDNIWWVHRDINKIKMDLSLNRFIELCNLVTNNQKDNM